MKNQLIILFVLFTFLHKIYICQCEEAETENIIINNPIEWQPIGNGGYGEILQKNQIAVKIQDQEEITDNELEILDVLKDQFYFASFYNPDGKQCYYVNDTKKIFIFMYAFDEDLLKLNDKREWGNQDEKEYLDFTHFELFDLMFKMARNLQILHKKYKIAHLDLKLENFFMIDKYFPVLGDFGLSKFLTNNLEQITLRSIQYYPMYAKTNKVYQHKFDIYSLGVCFYNLLEGQIFFYRTQGIEDTEEFFSESYKPENDNYELYKPLLKKMLQQITDNNYGIDEVCADLMEILQQFQEDDLDIQIDNQLNKEFQYFNSLIQTNVYFESKKEQIINEMIYRYGAYETYQSVKFDNGQEIKIKVQPTDKYQEFINMANQKLESSQKILI